MLVLGAACGGGDTVVTGTSPAGLAWELSGAGDPVVLLHGFSVDGRMWDPQMAALRERFRVLRYDLRGHGASAGFAGPYAAHEDLRDVLDAAGVDRARLVGLSAGAQIAIDFALTWPDRVTALVLASPGLGGYVARDPFDWMRPVMTAAQAGDALEAARSWAETPMMAVPSDAAGDSLMRAMVMDNAGLWLIATNPAQALDPPAIARLAELRVPTLILVGERDLPDIHRVADTLATCVVGAAQRALPDAGHMVNLAAPAAFTDAVLRFLSAPPSPPATPSRCRARR